ncbi:MULTISPECIES: ATP-binding cassette domain-containing protein [unclassified Streptomyces]|uniref:ATP-binding cassette domain-containing protein n=1 Tax=unclassified Streptomyces TaxID=2593676 RepID=UPI0022566436|nr:MULTISPECIES: ATP-binding cassette domain-containing protein [unclassified Streptomyces]MCX5330871.1 ATP-binding cassette domain-containing protein [Streptomyces sp. NBC_00140]MCX5360266.1 ATP-binding cassette domain-containing protein [Streptomyces sp. NBC_00124]
MIQAFGLTSNPRKELPPAVDDVSFEARAGRVTALLGAPGSGKTTALRLMLELQQGRGVTYFRGRPLRRIAHPSREVGVLLGDVPGHPARTVRGHLRMLCAAAGVPVRRADEVLEVVGLVSLREERLGTLSRGMDRRLGLACALLSDPHTLVLDDPADGLSAREGRWLYGMLRAHAAQGGTVLITATDPKEAARTTDRIVTLEEGRLVADQESADFSRTRLRPRVAVRTPHAARLAALLTKEARTAQRSVEVVREGGSRLSVYGSTCADVGETAYRYGILVHQLADEVGDMGPGAGEAPSDAPQATQGGYWLDAIRDPDTAAHGPAPATAPGTAEAQPKPSADEPRSDAAAFSPEAPAGADRSTSTDAREGHLDPGGAREVPSSFAQDGQADQGGAGEALLVAEADHSGAHEADGAAAADVGDRPATSARTYGDGATPRQPSACAAPHPAEGASSQHPTRPRAAAGVATLNALSELPPPISVRPAPSPLRPLRYEVRRAAGVGTGFLTGTAVLVVSALTAALLARVGHTPQHRLLAAWPQELPLPPAALGAGLLGAFAFGDEFRHPALAADRGTVPRRLGLLAAKLVVSAATALLLAFLTVGCDAEVLYLLYGRELAQVPADWLPLGASWFGLVIGCAWAGVLAAGIFRSTTAGLAAVVAVPVLVVPLVQKAFEGPAVRTAAGFPLRLREGLLLQWPFGGERYLSAAARMIAQPVGGALTLSLMALLCAYVLTTLRSRVR